MSTPRNQIGASNSRNRSADNPVRRYTHHVHPGSADNPVRRGGITADAAGLDRTVVNRARPSTTIEAKGRWMQPCRRLMAFKLTLLLAIASQSQTSTPGNWLNFRGPQASGLGTEPTLFADPTPHLAWKSDLPGRGLSSPIVIGDRVFVTCSSGPAQRRLHVICFETRTGSRLWERQFEAIGRTLCQEKTCVAAPSPASDGTRVFAVFSSGDAICLDLDGNVLWMRAFGIDYPNASNSIGMSSSPVFADGVFVTQLEADAQSLALGVDAVTGLNRWKLDRPKRANWTSPVLGATGGHAVVYLQSSAGVQAVEAASGRVAWTYTEGASTIPSSALSGDVLLVPSHGLTALQTTGEGRQLWRAGPLRPGTASPTVSGGRVFLLNDAGVLTCGDVKDGTRLWQIRLEGPFSATPMAAGPLLLVVSEKGLIQVVDVTQSEGQVVGKFDLAETILGTPSISAGALFIRSDGHLWRFGKP